MSESLLSFTAQLALFKVMASQSVNLLALLFGRLRHKHVVHLLLPVTDNCPS